MRIGYADPPYPGCAHLYKDHPDYGGEVDHAELLERLDRDYDGWVLHTSVPALTHVLDLCVRQNIIGYRIMSWVKPFAAFKRNVSVAYAWEPVLVKACRKPVVNGDVVMRDWLSEPITMQKGLTGAKPPKVCRWLFNVVGAAPGDELFDLFPGTGIVSETWEAWSGRERFGAGQLDLATEAS
jgi:hypothetical protein